jgi:hypothetical protein
VSLARVNVPVHERKTFRLAMGLERSNCENTPVALHPYDTSFGTLEQLYTTAGGVGTDDTKLGSCRMAQVNVSCVGDRKQRAVWEFVPTETESHALSAIKSTRLTE